MEITSTLRDLMQLSTQYQEQFRLLMSLSELGAKRPGRAPTCTDGLEAWILWWMSTTCNSEQPAVCCRFKRVGIMQRSKYYQEQFRLLMSLGQSMAKSAIGARVGSWLASHTDK